MKGTLAKLLLSLAVALSISAFSITTQAAHRHHSWHGGWGGGYYPYYGGYGYYGGYYGCRWVPGHWGKYGWRPAHRVCW